MRHQRIQRVLRQTFNSFEDETLFTGSSSYIKIWTFNSFEDETWTFYFMSERDTVIFFQFLWGWNDSIAQFIFGYIKLSIPLRMKQIVLREGAKLRLLTFNSFEDETWVRKKWLVYSWCYFQFLWGWNNLTSFKLRLRIGIFQFLWGWNLCVCNTQVPKKHLYFQFLWGWNLGDLDSIGNDQVFLLSIPLRMKLMLVKRKWVTPKSFQFLWGWNSEW